MSTQKTRRTKLLWGINLVLFASLVFLGIEQAGRGAEISNLESKIESANTEKRELSERIFKVSDDDKIIEDSQNLGFNKPTNILYFNSEDVSLTLR